MKRYTYIFPFDPQKRGIPISRVTNGGAELLNKPMEGLILANGFSGHGFQHGPAVGMVMAELILNGRAETIDIEPLAPTRFKEGKTIKESLAAFRD